MALNHRQEAFVSAYLGEARGIAAEAARLAGYADHRQQGHRLLTNVDIRARIDERLMLESMSSAEVLASLTEVAKADWRDFLQIRTNPQTGEVVDAKIVLGDKVKALELLGKYHKLFTDKTEHSADDDFLSALREAGNTRSKPPGGSGSDSD